jgi:hypothetical protein
MAGNIQTGGWLSGAAAVPDNRIVIGIPNFIYGMLMKGGSVSVSLGLGNLPASGAEDNVRVDMLQLLGEHQVFVKCHVDRISTRDQTSVFVRSGCLTSASTYSGHVTLLQCYHTSAPDGHAHIGSGAAPEISDDLEPATEL